MPKRSVKKTMKKAVKKVTGKAGAGRPKGSGKFGCPTTVIRVPVHLAQEIQEFVLQKTRPRNPPITERKSRSLNYFTTIHRAAFFYIKIRKFYSVTSLFSVSILFSITIPVSFKNIFSDISCPLTRNEKTRTVNDILYGFLSDYFIVLLIRFIFRSRFSFRSENRGYGLHLRRHPQYRDGYKYPSV